MQPVYMYHGVGSGAELAGADPVYAVSTVAFRRQLKVIGHSIALARQLVVDRAITAPSITFDDGHLTHYTNAYPALLEAGMTAEFYVNTALVGTPGFVDWVQLREMAAAGMSIQSHGHHHLFLADLDDVALRNELERSKAAIEAHLGKAVTVLAPPGGRYDRRTLETAQRLGYRALAVSEPGLWRRLDRPIVPRFPIYARTGIGTVRAYRRRFAAATLKAQLRYRLARLAQRLAGNQRYDTIRNRLVADRPTTDRPVEDRTPGPVPASDRRPASGPSGL